MAVRDDAARLGGRGVYLCRSAQRDAPDAACLDAALRRGGIGRTLRATVALDPELVESVGS